MLHLPLRKIQGSQQHNIEKTVEEREDIIVVLMAYLH